MAEGKWKRSERVPFPSVWRRFQGAKAFPNGKKPRFRVQDFTPDLMEDVLSNMENFFLEDEPLCESVNIKEDKVAVEEMLELWRNFTRHKLVLVCLLENKEELEDDSLPILVGCNMTGLMEPDSPHAETKSEKSKKIFDLLDYLESSANVFELYGVSEVMYALGLSVHRRFRGQGIGLEILKARFDMGRAVGIKLTSTVFTAIASQKLADRAGFETLNEIAYKDYKVNGEIVFNNLKTPTAKLMFKDLVIYAYSLEGIIRDNEYPCLPCCLAT